jgi:TonB family protein
MRKVISLVIVIFILGFSLSAQTPDSLGVYSVAEVMPSYVGGDAALYEYINHNVQYPKDALAQKKQGKVQLKMVIDENGTVMDAKVLRGVCSSIDSEATHVIKTTTGKWESGRINGKSVKTYKYLSVTFKIDTAEETEGSPIVFIGGDSAFLSFIRKHIEVPETMKEHPKLWDSVTVSVSFNSLNQIIAVVALKGPIKELNEDAYKSSTDR